MFARVHGRPAGDLLSDTRGQATGETGRRRNPAALVICPVIRTTPSFLLDQLFLRRRRRLLLRWRRRQRRKPVLLLDAHPPVSSPTRPVAIETRAHRIKTTFPDMRQRSGKAAGLSPAASIIKRLLSPQKPSSSKLEATVTGKWNCELLSRKSRRCWATEERREGVRNGEGSQRNIS